MFAPAPALQPALAVQPAGIVGQDDVEGYDTSDVDCGFDEDGTRESKVNSATDGRTQLLQFSRAILELIGANNVKQTHVMAVTCTGPPRVPLPSFRASTGVSSCRLRSRAPPPSNVQSPW